MKKIIKLTESDLTKIVKRVLNENEEGLINIPSRYKGIITELGKNVKPQDIIDLYNEIVASEGEAELLVKFENNSFLNDYGNETPIDVILDELNYSILGSEDEMGPSKKPNDFGDGDNNSFYLTDTVKLEFSKRLNAMTLSHVPTKTFGTRKLGQQDIKQLIDFLSKYII